MAMILQTGSWSHVLPNPLDGDQENNEAAVQVHTAITGVTRVYKRMGGQRRLSYTFRLSLDAAANLKVFLVNTAGAWFNLRDHRNRLWSVMLTTNPIEFVEYGRGRTSVTLEFLGVRV